MIIPRKFVEKCCETSEDDSVDVERLAHLAVDVLL